MSARSRRVALAASILTGAVLATVGSPTAGAQPADPTPASYINPDTGMATENPDVDPGSECETPDQADTQVVGDESTGAGNVHNDACLFDAAGGDVDAQVAWDSSGVGVISACPDPDGDGPKTATNSADRTRCVQSGFEEGGTNGPAGDGEYHIRVVSATEGDQTVTFCADPEGDGCANATATDTIAVTWTAASGSGPAAGDDNGGGPATSAVPRGGVDTGRAATSDGFPLLPVVASLGLLSLAGLAVRRARTTS